MRGGRQFEPAADNCAMQHRDDRQRAELDWLKGFVPRARMQHAFCDAALLQFREIEACAEMVPIADKHDGLDLFRRPTEPALERKDGFVVQRIALGRSREMHDGDLGLKLHMNVGEIICSGGRHRAFPSPHLLCRPQADLALVVAFISFGLPTPLRTELASKSPLVQSYFIYEGR